MQAYIFLQSVYEQVCIESFSMSVFLALHACYLRLARSAFALF